MRLDFDKRLYTSEVIVTDTSASAERLVEIIEGLEFMNLDRRESTTFQNVELIRIDSEYGKKLFNTVDPESPKRFLPKQDRKGIWLYDFFISRVGKLVMLSSPYTQIAKEVFREIDRELSFSSKEMKSKKIKSIQYQKVNLTKVLFEANNEAAFSLKVDSLEHIFKINYCMIEYVFSTGDKPMKQSVQIRGTDLAISDQYKYFVAPLLSGSKTKDDETLDFTLEPAKLGFSYTVGGLKRCSVSTDRHGNFRIWIGVRELPLIHLTDAIWRLMNQDLGKESPNVPIVSLSQDKVSDV